MNTLKPQPDAARPAFAAGTCAAAALWLMSHYARRPCQLIAHAIADQLEHLAQACDDGSLMHLQIPAAALLPQWRRIACGNAGARQH